MVRCLSVCPVDQHLPLATAGSRYPSIATGAHAVAAVASLLRAKVRGSSQTRYTRQKPLLLLPTVNNTKQLKIITFLNSTTPTNLFKKGKFK